MIKVNVEKHMNFIREYAEKQNIGGFSNLRKADLAKASRYDYQITGLSGEVAWYLARHGSIDKLKELLDFKYDTLRPAKKGDGGFDDSIIINGLDRKIDIKTSFVEDEMRIKKLNLVVSPRELHEDMVYIAGFSVGKTRDNPEYVCLAGWCFNEDVKDKWGYDPGKFCVKLKNLYTLDSLCPMKN
jgi:hypothetical protein